MADSYATRISKQFDQMMRERALKNQQERDAKAAQQAEAQKQAQAQTQQQPPQENRSTIEQIRQDRQAPGKDIY